jgi:hypothetical protein
MVNTGIPECGFVEGLVVDNPEIVGRKVNVITFWG